MRLLAGLLLFFGIAAGLGLWSTWMTMQHPPSMGRLHSGPWTAIPDTGGLAADPYQRAAIARDGVAPLPSSDAITFTATGDSDGRRLSGQCEYRIEGQIPASRLWTLAAYQSEGRIEPNDAKRYAVSSTFLVHDAGVPWVIALAPKARAGNWLPIPDHDAFILVLRLYDTTGASQITADKEQPLPSIIRSDCQ